MTFETSIKPATQAKIRSRLQTGMEVWRGIRLEGRPADPGDFGRGTYFSTSHCRAGCHGTTFRMNLRLANPLILTVEEAYTQIADRFGTITGMAGDPSSGAGDFSPRGLRAAEASAAMRALGYDGVAVVTPRRSGGSEIELVKFPKEFDDEVQNRVGREVRTGSLL
jgi:hypothetical protein